MGSEVTSYSDELFAQCLVDHRGTLMRVSSSILKEFHWAEDAVAETFLKAWENRASLKDYRTLPAWLMKICRNEALTLRRRVKRERTTSLHEETLRDPRAASDDWEHAQYRWALLEKLPKELKVCAELFFEGHSYAQISSIVGLPLSTVRGRIYLSRKCMRKEIEMKTEPPTSHTTFEEKLLNPTNGRIQWRGARIRFLGTVRIGGQALYSAAGKRLSRIPAILQNSALFRHPLETPFVKRDGYALAFFWELSAGPSVLMECYAIGDGSASDVLPRTTQTETFPNKKVVCFMCGGFPAQVRRAHVMSTLFGREDPNQAFRFDTWGAEGNGWVSMSCSDWGVCLITERRPSVREGTCVFTVAFSSPFAENGCRILVLDRNDRELEPSSASGGACASPKGHLRAETLEVDLPPEDVAGVVIYSRYSARVDWGAIRIPPESKRNRRSQ